MAERVEKKNKDTSVQTFAIQKPSAVTVRDLDIEKKASQEPIVFEKVIPAPEDLRVPMEDLNSLDSEKSIEARRAFLSNLDFKDEGIWSPTVEKDNKFL